MIIIKKSILFFMILVGLSCSSENEVIEKLEYTEGVTHLELDRVSNEKVEQGQAVFKQKCASCHKMEFKSIAPDIADLCSVHKNEWIFNYLLDNRADTTFIFDKQLIPLKTKDRCPIIIEKEKEAYAILDYLRQYRVWIHEFN